MDALSVSKTQKKVELERLRKAVMELRIQLGGKMANERRRLLGLRMSGLCDEIRQIKDWLAAQRVIGPKHRVSEEALVRRERHKWTFDLAARREAAGYTEEPAEVCSRCLYFKEAVSQARERYPARCVRHEFQVSPAGVCDSFEHLPAPKLAKASIEDQP
jgi:hypothetical protein